MEIELLYKPGCKRCMEALEWLKNRCPEFTQRVLPEDAPDAVLLKEWYKKSRMPLRAFWNTDEVSFRRWTKLVH